MKLIMAYQILIQRLLHVQLLQRHLLGDGIDCRVMFTMKLDYRKVMFRVLTMPRNRCPVQPNILHPHPLLPSDFHVVQELRVS
ncbi:MAG: hypothetical protein UV09_C0004G0011 [Candidatus Gottesmanbacteria bacterium GW2011_GWA2_42_18]|uniref:Uncharacterized protein n=1 Tax=Candidatus Gottesmanbacteria bacterium GW2011_GWA2_42_18 TaxID=1618442 RepID=A0A0G0ZFM8_9BACT|nr:MAG: hypothetical protein UV09_C0004G0011 [Candidatus Gottesmanbacteria bacterium GW2011_GWA2_42_18]